MPRQSFWAVLAKFVLHLRINCYICIFQLPIKILTPTYTFDGLITMSSTNSHDKCTFTTREAACKCF